MLCSSNARSDGPCWSITSTTPLTCPSMPTAAISALKPPPYAPSVTTLASLGNRFSSLHPAQTKERRFSQFTAMRSRSWSCRDVLIANAARDVGVSCAVLAGSAPLAHVSTPNSSPNRAWALESMDSIINSRHASNAESTSSSKLRECSL